MFIDALQMTIILFSFFLVKWLIVLEYSEYSELKKNIANRFRLVYLHLLYTCFFMPFIEIKTFIQSFPCQSAVDVFLFWGFLNFSYGG